MNNNFYLKRIAPISFYSLFLFMINNSYASVFKLILGLHHFFADRKTYFFFILIFYLLKITARVESLYIKSQAAIVVIIIIRIIIINGGKKNLFKDYFSKPPLNARNIDKI